MARGPGGAASARLGVFVLLLGAAAVAAATVGVPDLDQLRTDVADAGPVWFALVYAVATLAPLPKNMLSVAAGLVFGLVAGVVLVLVAAVLGATVAFGLGRVLGREAVERFTGARVARIDAAVRRRGLIAVIGLRLVPVLPFTAINYAAGLTAVRVRDYLLGTAVGIVPGTVAYVALGAYGSTPGEWPFIVAVVLLVALSAGGAVLVRRRRGADRSGPGPADRSSTGTITT
jgi:uncharacterized membrane protein YdjX (TVP38/TMEM64 family)